MTLHTLNYRHTLLVYYNQVKRKKKRKADWVIVRERGKLGGREKVRSGVSIFGNSERCPVFLSIAAFCTQFSSVVSCVIAMRGVMKVRSGVSIFGNADRVLPCF